VGRAPERYVAVFSATAFATGVVGGVRLVLLSIADFAFAPGGASCRALDIPLHETGFIAVNDFSF